MHQSISNSAKIVLSSLKSQHIDATNKTLVNLKDLLTELGYSAELNALGQALPVAINKGVQSAHIGVVQDPAGSAIGSGHFPSGSGGSGAIYKHFSDLKPVPQINQTEAVFNESEQDGGRVLHSYSPYLNGSPSDLKDCTTALQDLSNTYFNAFMAERLLPPAPGTPEVVTEFGAVPLAGRIFAQAFKNETLNHLHPGYTIASLLIAHAEMIRANKTLPAVKVYYFDSTVYNVAVSVLDEVGNDLAN